ncbi:gap junction protein alpha 4 [Mugil cephalus]|uniref:gap junction protein alpha 4 n=1 Tax=Mugil cephalus TaxID=48193 RepID=UPI001FB711C1|nr:gap junction protein alpha 4 [Mugil cephalus]
MSRADWSFLEHLLEEGQEFSTAIGRVWLTVLFLFRILVLGTAAESAWDDEQADFVCNTRQPGCTAVCYDRAFPISHFRYFVLQVIFVSTPTIFYFGFVAIRAGKKKEEDGKQAEEGGGGSKTDKTKREGDDNNATKDNGEEKEKEKSGGKGRKSEKPPIEAPKLKGKLLGAYTLSILVKVILEAGFIVGLWLLYGGFFIADKFECTGPPCPHIVDCFVSRPTEKTIFTIYIQVIAAISVLLNFTELLYLLQLAISHRLEKRYRTQNEDYLPRPKQVPARQETLNLEAEAPAVYEAGSQISVPVQVEPARHQNPHEPFQDMAVEVKWGSGDAGNDMLPSYVNCTRAMRTTHSPRVYYNKHAHHTGKSTRASHKGHSKQKHYV